jgi:hypothetical protein
MFVKPESWEFSAARLRIWARARKYGWKYKIMRKLAGDYCFGTGLGRSPVEESHLLRHPGSMEIRHSLAGFAHSLARDRRELAAMRARPALHHSYCI